MKRFTKKGGLDFNDKNLSLVNELGYSYIYNRLAGFEDKLESKQLIELPNGWLHILKLLTVASMCYADIKHLMESKIKESKEIADLYFSCPNVQGSTNLRALSSLAESELDCNKIKGFEDIIDAMPNLKEIFNKNKT